MAHLVLMQLLSLSLYVALVGFCFCDGFKLHTARKLIWFAVFIAMAAYVSKTTGQLELPLILPLPTLLAIVLGAFEIKSRKTAQRGPVSQAH